MSKLFVIIVYLLNAKTGDPEQQYVSSQPMQLEQCEQALIERGPVPVKDGQATFMVCHKVGVEDVSI